MKHKLTAVAIVLVCSLTLAVLVGGSQPSNQLNIFVPMGGIEQAEVQQVSGEQVVINIGDSPQGGNPGEPMLPYKQVCILVPPDADLEKVSSGLASENWEELPGEYEIAPAPPAAHTAGDGPVISWGGKDESVIVNGETAVYTAMMHIFRAGRWRLYRLVNSGSGSSWSCVYGLLSIILCKRRFEHLNQYSRF